MKRFVETLLCLSIAICGHGVGADSPHVRTDPAPLWVLASAKLRRFWAFHMPRHPSGSLRWRAPQPVRPWAGVRKAVSYGHDCMQKPYPSDLAPLGVTPAEDCLTVNVWRPTGTKAGDHLPVLVWIYGGGFVNGGASPAVYSGESFARHGVMFVSFNYRLGRFGFFAFPELTREDPDHGLVANYGHMDALAAMHWVQRNIAAFGGDPKQVTIYGQSAGAAQVYMLLTAPLADGLFTRAIVQSGGAAAVERPEL